MADTIVRTPTTVETNYQYRDFWSEYLPKAVDELETVQSQNCYVPRWYRVPQNKFDTLQPGKMIQDTIRIVPGSWIVGISHDENANSTPFNVQITDVKFNYRWFSEPIPSSYIAKNGSILNLLHKPCPVVAPGVFKIEIWLPPTAESAQICSVSLAVAELIRGM